MTGPGQRVWSVGPWCLVPGHPLRSIMGLAGSGLRKGDSVVQKPEMEGVLVVRLCWHVCSVYCWVDCGVGRFLWNVGSKGPTTKGSVR